MTFYKYYHFIQLLPAVHTYRHRALPIGHSLSVLPKATDPQPAETELSHDVRKIWPFSSSGAARFTSDVSHSQNHFVVPLRRWGCKLPENRSNTIILAPLVLEDILSQSAKAAKLIHNPLWSFNSYTWQEQEKREEGVATKRKGWTMNR